MSGSEAQRGDDRTRLSEKEVEVLQYVRHTHRHCTQHYRLVRVAEFAEVAHITDRTPLDGQRCCHGNTQTTTTLPINQFNSEEMKNRPITSREIESRPTRERVAVTLHKDALHVGVGEAIVLYGRRATARDER
jgi:hypothetical protein